MFSEFTVSGRNPVIATVLPIDDDATRQQALQATNMIQNPYAPPELATATSDAFDDDRSLSKPMIPAVIGILTYGSSSPYALVLCIEHYLSRRLRPVPRTTHAATALAALGTVGWFALNLACYSQTIDLLAGNPTSMYAQIGLMTWMATIIFFAWAIWRFVRFMRQHEAADPPDTQR